jgi:hypothetical protein
MKKTIYIAAILALTACSNDELVESTAKDQSRINVRVVTSNPSRADESSDTDFRHDSNTEELTFSLYAGYSSYSGVPQVVNNTYTYLEGELMNYDNGTCSFDGGKDYYWPMTKDSDSNYQYLSFFGYHDYNVDSDMTYGDLGAVGVVDGQYTLLEDDQYDKNSQVALHFTGITLPQDAKEQDDILYAVGQAPLNYDNSDEGVQLNFRHALSQLAVQFENVSSAQNIYAEVHSVSFVNVARDGELVIYNSKQGKDVILSQYKDSPDDNRKTYNAYENCLWSPALDDDDDSYNVVTYTFGEENEDDPENQYVGLVPGNSYYTGVRETGIIANNSSTKHDVNLLVVPMTKNLMKNAKIKLRCNLYNLADYNDFVNDSKGMSPDKAHELLVKGNSTHAAYGVPIYAHEEVNLDDIPDDDYNEDPSSFYFNDIYFNVPEIEGGWQAGKKYIYTIKLGTGTTTAKDENDNEFLVPIEITVSVDDWALDKKSVTTEDTTEEITEDNVNI